MSSSFPSTDSLRIDPAFSSDPLNNPNAIYWHHNPSYSSSSSDSGSAHSYSTSSSSASSSGSDMPSLSVLPNPTSSVKKKKKSSQPSEAPSPAKGANPVLSHPPLTRSRSSLFRQKGHPLDRIDELDESSPLGLLHHKGPYEAAKKSNSNSQHRLPPGLNVEQDIDEHNSKYLSAELDEDSEDETIKRRRAAKAAKKSSRSKHSKTSPTPQQQQPASAAVIGQPLGLVPGQIVPRGLLESYQLNPNLTVPPTTPGHPVSWNNIQPEAARHFPSASPSPSLAIPADPWTSLPSTSPSPVSLIGASHPSVNRLRRQTSTESISSDSSTPTTSSHSRSSRDSQSHRPQVAPRHRGRHHHGPPARNLAPRHVAENMRQQQFALQASMMNTLPTTPALEDILVPTTPRSSQSTLPTGALEPVLPQSLPLSPAFSQTQFDRREEAPFPGADPLEQQRLISQVDMLTSTMDDVTLAKPPTDMAKRASNRQSKQEQFDKVSKHNSGYLSGAGELLVEAPPPYSDRGAPYLDGLKSEKQPVILSPPPRWAQDYDARGDWNRAPGLNGLTSSPSPAPFPSRPQRHTPSPALTPSSSSMGEDSFDPYRDSVYSPPSQASHNVPAPIGSGFYGSNDLYQNYSRDPNGFLGHDSNNPSAASLLTSNSSHSSMNNARQRPHYLPKKLVMPAPLQQQAQARPFSSPDVNLAARGQAMGQGASRFSAPAMPNGLAAFEPNTFYQPLESTSPYRQSSINHGTSTESFRSQEAVFHAEHHGRRLLKKKNASPPMMDWGPDQVNKSSSSLDLLQQQRLSPPSAAKEAARTTKRLSKRRSEI